MDEVMALRQRIEELNSRIEDYEQDGNFGLFFALNRKQNETARSLNSFTLDLTSDDKGFDRYMKLCSSLKETIEAANWLRINYLKMDEKEVGEAEKKGVPLIEQMAKKMKSV